MNLELDSKEVEAVLLEWAGRNWPGAFNEVGGANYQAIRGVTFTRVEPTAAKSAIEAPEESPEAPL